MTMEDEGKIQKQYEIGVLIRKEDDIAEVRRVIAAHGGELTNDFQAKKIVLAYPIKKEKEAVFAWGVFAASGVEAKQLEQDLRTTAVVLRSLITIPLGSKKSVEAAAAEKKWNRTKHEPVVAEAKIVPQTLSNEALTKKIEEMLQ